MQVLAEVHHVDRAIHVILLEFDFGQRQVFGQIKGCAIATQENGCAIFFLGQPQLLIDLDDHRAAL